MGLRSLFAASTSCVVMTELPLDHRVAHVVSHDLDDFRCRPSRVCFTPQPRPGFSLQGFIPSPQPEPTRRRPVPSRRLAAFACRGCPQRQLQPPRPQGFLPWRSPWRRRWCYPSPPLDPLLGFPPPGSPSPRRRNAFTSLPLMVFNADYRSIRRCGLQRVSDSEPDRSLSRPADLLEVCCLPNCSGEAVRSSLRSTSTADRLMSE